MPEPWVSFQVMTSVLSAPECPGSGLVSIKYVHLSPFHLLPFIGKALSLLLRSSAPTPPHTCTHVHTCTCNRAHTCVHARIMNISTHMRNHTHRNAGTYRCSHVPMCIYKYSQPRNTCTQVGVLTGVQAHAHTHMRAFPNMHTCKHAHTHIRLRSSRLSARLPLKRCF